jgi:hypothetical protein
MQAGMAITAYGLLPESHQQLSQESSVMLLKLGPSFHLGMTAVIGMRKDASAMSNA